MSKVITSSIADAIAAGLRGDTNISFDDSIDGNVGQRPVFLASTQTCNGTDAISLRYRSLNDDGATVFVEEERSADNEVTHGPEDVAFLVMREGLIDGPAAALNVRVETNDSSKTRRFTTVHFVFLVPTRSQPLMI